MNTTSDIRTSAEYWADRAGRMQFYAEALVDLSERADALTADQLRARLRFDAELARDALARLETSGRPA